MPNVGDEPRRRRRDTIDDREADRLIGRSLGVVALIGTGCLFVSWMGTGTVRREFPLQLDVNTTPPAVLNALPGIGPVRTRAIVEARRARPLESLDEMDRRVRGIGPATIRAIRPYLRFDSDLPTTDR